MTGLRLVLAACALFAAGAATAQAVPPLADGVRPIRVSGVGLTVSDLERSRAFYTDVLGLRVDARVPAQGKAVEYLLGMTGDLRADTLVVLRQGEVKPGATGFGRLVLVVPDGRAMAERVAAAGVPQPTPPRDGTNVVSDPDGYRIELYQRPAPPPR